MNKGLFVIFFFLFEVSLVAQTGSSMFKEKNVLILHSYHKGMQWTDEMSKGIKDGIGEGVEVHTEYLDSKRFVSDTLFMKPYLELFKYKVRNKCDLIICCDNNSFDFLKTWAFPIVKDLPVIFCGINEFEKHDLGSLNMVTGVNEKGDYEGNFRLISRLHPQRDKLYVITENSNSGKRVDKHIAHVLRQNSISFKRVQYLSQTTYSELIDTISSLDQNSVVYLNFMSRDVQNNYLGFIKTAALISEHSKAPVYTGWHFNLNDKIFGGLTISGYQQGYDAALMAKDILSGTSVRSVGVKWSTKSKCYLNYELLKSEKVDFSLLPEDTEFFNRKETLFERSKAVITFSVVIVSVLIIIILNLILVSRNGAIAKAKAENSDRLKSAFLANMSHEIRTPMNAIIGFSEILIDKDTSDEEKDVYSKIIYDNGHYLLDIINDILDLSKIESGNINIFKENVDVNEVILNQYDFFKRQAQNKGLEFKLFKPETECQIFTDSTRLIQVMNNLMSNAIKFTAEGCITVGYQKKGEFIEFYVKDSGIGIPSNMKKEVFKAFSQVHTANSKHLGGSGLGLAISFQTVQALGGKIWFESKEGQGSEFYFTIPKK